MTMDSALRLKGWMVFAVLSAAILVAFGSMILTAFPSIGGHSSSLFGPGVALLELLFFGWALSVGAAMNSRLPEELRRGYLLPAVGLVIATGYIFSFAGQFSAPTGPQTSGYLPVALHLFSMAVNVYLLWYVSRALVAAEEKGRPPLDRVLGLFFVLWFSMLLPIGVWWAHERARSVARASETAR